LQQTYAKSRAAPLQSNVRDHGIHFPKKPWKEIVTEETSQTIEIRNKPNPWLYGPPLFLTAAAISTQPNFLGYITALIVFIALAAWWLLRSQAVPEMQNCLVREVLACICHSVLQEWRLGNSLEQLQR
jgi:hypothetical protein